MMNKIKAHTYKEGNRKIKIPFDGKTYLNATEVYQAFGKSSNAFSNWKSRTLIPYAEKLLKLGKFPDSQNVSSVDDLIVIKTGGNKLHEQGTWLHPKLAILFARWISTEFEIWCDEKIAELLSEGIVYLNENDADMVDLHKDICSCAFPGSHKWKRSFRKALIDHEKEGKNIKSFKALMDQLRSSIKTENREIMYQRIVEVIDELYEEDILSRTSRDSMRDIAETNLIRILKANKTRAITALKLTKTKFSINSEAPAIVIEKEEDAILEIEEVSVDPFISIDEVKVQMKAEHDECIKATEEIQDSKELAFKVRCAEIGIRSTLTSEHIMPCYISDDNFHSDLAVCTKLIESSKYKILYQGTVIINEKKLSDGDKFPFLVGECTVPFTGVMRAAIWSNIGQLFLRLTKANMHSDDSVALELAIKPVDNSVFRGVNHVKTACAVFNSNTNYLLVYAIRENGLK